MPDRFIWTFSTKHVIVYSLATARGTGILKHSIESLKELKIIRIVLVEGFIVEPMPAAEFSYLLLIVYLGVH